MMSKLYPYQEEYLKTLPMRGIVDAELGLGKSIMSLEFYKRKELSPISICYSGILEKGGV